MAVCAVFEEKKHTLLQEIEVEHTGEREAFYHSYEPYCEDISYLLFPPSWMDCGRFCLVSSVFPVVFLRRGGFLHCTSRALCYSSFRVLSFSLPVFLSLYQFVYHLFFYAEHKTVCVWGGESE